jgi:hypothetical protein
LVEGVWRVVHEPAVYLGREPPSTKGNTVAKNEKTSPKVATIASKVLQGHKPTPKEAKALAASVLTQAPDKPKKKTGK